jgi:hypothetical protein
MNSSLLVRLLAMMAFGSVAAFAIPQNFSQGGGFLIQAGMAFEQFAADKATWAPGAALKGEWNPPAANGAQTLKNDAVVFGLPASEITAERSSDRVSRFVVVFREGDKKKGGKFFDQVAQQVGAFAGSAGEADGRAAKTFRKDDVRIVVRGKSAREVIVEITPTR